METIKVYALDNHVSVSSFIFNKCEQKWQQNYYSRSDRRLSTTFCNVLRYSV